MTEVRQRPTPRVRFREVSVKRELTVYSWASTVARVAWFEAVVLYYFTMCQAVFSKSSRTIHCLAYHCLRNSTNS